MGKATYIIPHGPFCNEGDNICPYWQRRFLGTVKVTYCEFLEQYDLYVPTDEEHYALVDYLDGEEVFDKVDQLSFLADKCKMCGINDGT